MFFTPSVRHFVGRGDRVDLVCLSTGNFDGLGDVRRRELEKSAQILGIKSVSIIDDK
jgi:N-acetylglucosaminylphosphatidylinositol deacetylase